MQLETIVATLNKQKPDLFFSDAEVRLACQIIANKEFTMRTWQNWKRLADDDGAPLVAQYRTRLSFGQTLVLMAIALSRTDELGYPCAENKPLPSNDEIWRSLHQSHPIMPRLSAQQYFESVIGSCDERLPGGARPWKRTNELPAELAKLGYRGVSERSLYIKIGDLIKQRSKHFPAHVAGYARALDALRQPQAS